MRGSNMSKKNQAVWNIKTVVWNLLMCIVMAGGAVLVPFLKESGHAFEPLYLGMAVLLAVIAAIYILCFEAKAAEGLLFWLVPLVFVISVAFILLFDNPFVFPFWTFGGLLLLCAFKLRYGVLMNLFLLYVIGSMQTEFLSEVLMIQILCLVLLGFVMPYVKAWKDAVNVFVSVAAVLISVRIICYFTMGKEALTGDIFSVAITYFIVIGAVLLLSRCLQEAEWFQEQNENFDFLEELAAGVEGQLFDGSEYMVTDETEYEEPMVPANDYAFSTDEAEDLPTLSADYNARLNELSFETSPLLEEFAQKHPNAFQHVRRVAFFASEVAKQMEDVNVLLVMCGGYYHEIGRLQGKRTLENTLLIAEKNEFPPSLVSVLREHTVDGDKPRSKEAALLLLTDNICGTCEYLRKTQKGKILVAKVIDRALNLRLAKGDLSQSGLTVKDLSVIRNGMIEVMKEELF